MLTRNRLCGEIIVLADDTINLFHGCKEREGQERVSDMVRCNVQLSVGIEQQQELVQRTFFDWIRHVAFRLAGEMTTMNTMLIHNFLHLHGVGV